MLTTMLIPAVGVNRTLLSGEKRSSASTSPTLQPRVWLLADDVEWKGLCLTSVHLSWGVRPLREPLSATAQTAGEHVRKFESSGAFS